MLSPCPTLLIKPIHKSKMLPTATSGDNEGLSSGTAAQTRQQKLDVFPCKPLIGVILQYVIITYVCAFKMNLKRFVVVQ